MSESTDRKWICLRCRSVIKYPTQPPEDGPTKSCYKPPFKHNWDEVTKDDNEKE